MQKKINSQSQHRPFTKTALLFAVLLNISLASAALPPYYQSAAEISAILNNQTLSKRLGIGSPVHSIEKSANGYLVTAGTCSIVARVTYLPPPPNFIGPAKFKILVGNPICE